MQKHSTPKPAPIKSLWRERHSRAWSFFCPQCRAARKVSTHPDPGRLENYARVALCSVVFTIAGWQWFTWKGIVSFVPFWAAFEVFHRARMRTLMACPHCGFDPYLYLADVKLARQEIEDHWRRKFAEHGIPYPAPKHGPGQAPEKEPETEIELQADPPEAEPPSRSH
jgi:hypothetical protein